MGQDKVTGCEYDQNTLFTCIKLLKNLKTKAIYKKHQVH